MSPILVLPDAAGPDGTGLSMDRDDYLPLEELLTRSDWRGRRCEPPPHLSQMVEVREETRDPRVVRLILWGDLADMRSLSSSIGRFRHLTHLDFHSSDITSLPSSIGQLKNLEELLLIWTERLVRLPDEIGNLVSLKRLNLQNSGITCIPPSIGQLKKLQFLNLHGTGLSVLPEEIGDLTSLNYLSLSKTKIASLPPCVGNLKNLEFLYLVGMGLWVMPEEFGDLTSLNYLSLKNTKITSLPSSIGNLKNLDRLFLCGTGLSVLPEEIGDLTSLNYLDLEETKITSLPSSIRNLKNLDQLFLYGAGLSVLPKEIGDLTSLNYLSLKNTKIKSLPSSIGNLKNLDQLFLYGTDLSVLPVEIGDLTSLNYLDLGGTKITSLPSSIGNLKNLVGLYLRGMVSLLDLPEEIWNLNALVCLDLCGSSVQKLSSSIAKFSNLRILDLQDSSVTALPDSFQKLKSLEYLGVSGAPLSANASIDKLFQVTKSCKFLGCLGMKKGSLNQNLEEKLGYVLACNRVRRRMEWLLTDSTATIIQALPKLWPLILNDAVMAHSDFPIRPTYYDDSFCNYTPPCAIRKLDAIHQFLGSCREVFLQTIIDHKARPPTGRKVYFSYFKIHNTIVKLIPKMKEFGPSVIVAIDQGGSPFVQMLKTELQALVLTVSLELKHNFSDLDEHTIHRHQWFDEQSEAGRMVANQKVLIVGEIDNTRAILRHCVEQVLQTNTPGNVAVAVMHNKRRAKLGGGFPKGVVYLAGAVVEDHWECCYPWDAMSHGNTLEEHEALARRCHYDW